MSPVRAGRADEVEQIYEVHRDSVNALCGSHYTEEQLRGWLAGRSARMYLPAIERGRLWVFEDEARELCGFAEIDGNELTKLFIRGDRAARGVGRTLLETAAAAIRATGAAKVVVEATTNARDFYVRQGFIETGRGEFSHGEGGEPLQIVKMERSLTE